MFLHCYRCPNVIRLILISMHCPIRQTQVLHWTELLIWPQIIRSLILTNDSMLTSTDHKWLIISIWMPPKMYWHSATHRLQLTAAKLEITVSFHLILYKSNYYLNTSKLIKIYIRSTDHKVLRRLGMHHKRRLLRHSQDTYPDIHWSTTNERYVQFVHSK